MRDYPCLKIGDARLSLVYPYTVNDRLIIKFDVENNNDLFFENSVHITRSLSRRIIITNDKQEEFVIEFNGYTAEQYNYQCKIICERFRMNNVEDTRIYEEEFRDFERYGYFSIFDYWIQKCSNQVRSIERGMTYYGSTYENFKSILIHQDRGDVYNRYYSTNFVNESRVANLFSTPVRGQRSRVSFSDWDNLSENRVKLIHPYNYIPEYKKWYADGENPDTTLLLGAEIEVDEGGETDETAEAVLKIMHSGELKEDKMFAVHDGSLNRGIEFVTMPCSLAYHKSLPYRDMFKYLDEHGYKGHDSEKAGLHIHINRDFFKNKYQNKTMEEVFIHNIYPSGSTVELPKGTDIDSVEVYQYSFATENVVKIPYCVSSNGYYIMNDKLLCLPSGDHNRGKRYVVEYRKRVFVLESQDSEQECIGKLMYIIEKFEDEMSAISRRDCRYAKLIGYNGEKCKELYSKGYKVRDKYAAVNILHQDTIEIRIFKSTLRYETFINTLEFVSNLAYFVKDHTEEEIENMTWDDLMDTFSDELKSYYLKRKEIEDKKKTEKKENTVYSPYQSISTTNRNGRIYISGQGFDEIRSLNCITAPLVAEDNDDVREAITNLRRSMEASFTIEPLYNYDVDRLQPTEVDEIKKEIKDIKQKMKYTENYLEKKVLQQDLVNANKRLKKAKSKKKSETETN